MVGEFGVSKLGYDEGGCELEGNRGTSPVQIFYQPVGPFIRPCSYEICYKRPRAAQLVLKSCLPLLAPAIVRDSGRNDGLCGKIGTFVLSKSCVVMADSKQARENHAEISDSRRFPTHGRSARSD